MSVVLTLGGEAGPEARNERSAFAAGVGCAPDEYRNLEFRFRQKGFSRKLQ